MWCPTFSLCHPETCAIIQGIIALNAIIARHSCRTKIELLSPTLEANSSCFVLHKLLMLAVSFQSFLFCTGECCFCLQSFSLTTLCAETHGIARTFQLVAATDHLEGAPGSTEDEKDLIARETREIMSDAIKSYWIMLNQQTIESKNVKVASLHNFAKGKESRILKTFRVPKTPSQMAMHKSSLGWCRMFWALFLMRNHTQGNKK